MLKKALIHRYNNGPDILAVEKNGCSEVYQRSRDYGHEIVIVVPTTKAGTVIAVWGDTNGDQYRPKQSKTWPGQPDKYPVRIDMENVKYTTVYNVKDAVTKAGATWAAAWTIITVDQLDTSLLYS